MARRKERLSCRKFDLPGQAGSLTENSEFLSFCDNRESLFNARLAELMDRLLWRKTGGREFENSKQSFDVQILLPPT